jgi:hypothetical protein
MRSKIVSIVLAAGLALGLATAAPAVTPQGSTPKPTPPGRGDVLPSRERPQGEQWGPHQPFPQGSLSSARIRLERTACFGTCPIYTVEIRGDGTVIWNGARFVKAVGVRRYRISVAKVRQLVEQLRRANFYSALESYVDRGITDMPSATITVTYGGVTKSVHDYAGTRVGMPQAIKDLEAAIDEAAGTKALIGPPQRGRR